MEKQKDQLQILTSKMKETNSKIEQLIKINDELDNKFKIFVFEAEKSPRNASLLLTITTAMKCKCKENKDVKILGVLKLLEQKRKVGSRVQLKLHTH